MKKYVRCKVCGYIMEEKDLKDVCPACGVPKTAFVEHKFNISEKRLGILNLHLHPISVHFPEAIAVFTLGFLVIAFITAGTFSDNLITTTKMLSLIFPLTVIIAALSGIYDGKVRFKKLSPPYLKIKIYAGIVLLFSSTLTTILLQMDFFSPTGKVLLILLSLINVGTCIVLGKIGGTLIDSHMPG